MTPIGKTLAGLLPAFAAMPSLADNCEPIRAQIEAKFKAGGLVGYSVTVVDATPAPTAKVVGSCGNGTKRIVFIPGAASASPVARIGVAASAAAKPKTDPILTECRDGTVSTTGSCRK